MSPNDLRDKPEQTPPDRIEAVVRRWLRQVVVGLGLCPFAAEPLRRGRVRIRISAAESEQTLLMDLHDEVVGLAAAPADDIETTLLVVPRMLGDFERYNQFLDLVDAMLLEFGWEGVCQVASFHPGYRFDGTEPEDASNLTNRSPYPILHILRERSVESALETHPDPAAIAGRNIARVESLNERERRIRFPYLFEPRDD